MAKLLGCWPPYQLNRLREALDELESTVDATRDPDILPWLTRMLVVRSSGYLEQTAKEVFWGYIQDRAGGLIRAFGHSWLEKSRNPSPSNLIDMIGRFDHALRVEFEELLDANDQQLRRELTFLVDRRNHIAHGLSEGITRDKAIALKSVSIDISDWLILKFNPLRT